MIQVDGTVQTGRKEEVMASHASLTHGWTPPVDANQSVKGKEEEILIDMDNVNVSYGDRKVTSFCLLGSSRCHSTHQSSNRS